MLTTPVRQYFRVNTCRRSRAQRSRREIAKRRSARGHRTVGPRSRGARCHCRVVVIRGCRPANRGPPGRPGRAFCRSSARCSILPRAEDRVRGRPLLARPLPIAVGNESLEITRPDGRTTTVASDTDVSGIYTVRRAGSDDVTHFAVNVDTRESDLAQADARQVATTIEARARRPTVQQTNGNSCVDRLAVNRYCGRHWRCCSWKCAWLGSLAGGVA